MSKTVGGTAHKYYYSGSLLLAEEWGNNLMVFLYDANGAPIGMKYRTTSMDAGVWNTYWYERNLQGDVVAIYNESGAKVASYVYDAWGNFITTYHNGGASLTPVIKNPLLYRGYYYDRDLGMYYLQTRYYDSNIGRFLNADSALYDGLLGYNMYAYCNNDPVNYVDHAGKDAAAILGWWVFGGGAIAAIEPSLIGEIVVAVGAVALAAIAVVEAISTVFSVEEETPQSVTEEDSQQNAVPDIDYPGDDPTVAPDEYEWRGPGKQGGKEGNYYNPKNKSSLHPDLDHPNPIGPHWDYTGPEGKFRIFPDGRIVPKH